MNSAPGSMLVWMHILKTDKRNPTANANAVGLLFEMLMFKCILLNFLYTNTEFLCIIVLLNKKGALIL